jgi:hypothetical protein
MKLSIVLDMSNAAFDDAPMSEAARILRELADKLDNDQSEVTCAPNHVCPLRDVNGNICGEVWAKET